MRASTIQLVGALLVASLFSSPAWAAWPTLGRALTSAIKDQEAPRIATDGAGGAIVVWQDFRNPRVNVFARRVLASGELDPAWPVDGLSVLDDSTALDTAADGQQFPVTVSDGAGGAIVAWQDGRSPGELDIFAQHVLATGRVDPAWPRNGRALCTARGQQDIPTIVSDGAGGAIVTWMDGRSSVTNVDIFAQHVLFTGAIDPRWPADGIALCTAPAPQAFPRIASDGSGGGIVTWYDFRPAASGIDVYAQHVSNSGVVDPAWPANGRALSLAAQTQVDPSIVSDGAHGAIVTWSDDRDGLSHIYAQRVMGTGAIAAGWPADGRAVCTAPIEQLHPIPTPDGANGAIITWQDARSGHHNPFAQHVLAAGAVDSSWPVNGVALSLSPGEGGYLSIVTDRAGGAIVAWEEDSFVLVNHVRSSGTLDPAFPVNGRFVRLLTTFQHSPELTTSGTSDAIVTWADGATNLDFDIYATLVATGGTVDVEPGMAAPDIRFALPRPNPAVATVTLRFALPRAANVSLAIFDAGGRRVRALASGPRPEGEQVVTWDLRNESGSPAAAGIYFARLVVEGRVLTRKFAKAN